MSATGLIDELGLDDATWDSDERDMKLGGLIPPGMYHARLLSATEKVTTENVKDELKFEIVHGEYAGKVVREDVWHKGKDEEKTEKAKVRRRMFGSRLGLLEKAIVDGKKRYVLAPGKYHLRDCLGAEVIIDVKIEEQKGTGDNAGKVFSNNRLNYDGIYTLDDPKVKDVPRAASSVRSPMPKPSAPPDLDGL